MTLFMSAIMSESTKCCLLTYWADEFSWKRFFTLRHEPYRYTPRLTCCFSLSVSSDSRLHHVYVLKQTLFIYWASILKHLYGKKKKKRSISFESAVSTKFNGLIPVIWLILSIFCTFLYLVLPLLWLWIGLLRFTDMNRNSFLNILTILLLVWKLC